MFFSPRHSRHTKHQVGAFVLGLAARYLRYGPCWREEIYGGAYPKPGDDYVSNSQNCRPTYCFVLASAMMG